MSTIVISILNSAIQVLFGVRFIFVSNPDFSPNWSAYTQRSKILIESGGQDSPAQMVMDR